MPANNELRREGSAQRRSGVGSQKHPPGFRSEPVREYRQPDRSVASALRGPKSIDPGQSRRRLSVSNPAFSEGSIATQRSALKHTMDVIQTREQPGKDTAGRA